MSSTTRFSTAMLATAIFMIGVLAAAQTPLGTVFTYQGLLRNGSQPANGTFNFEFKLFTAEVGGSQVGSTNTINSVATDGGVFTVDLDFGSSAFGSDARWLEIGVEDAGLGGGFTLLSPRQRIRPAPAALNIADTGGNIPVTTRNFIVGAGQTVAVNQVVSFLPGTATVRPGFATRLTHFSPEQIVSFDPMQLPAASRLSANAFVAAYRLDTLLRPSMRVVTVSGPGLSFGPQNNAQVSLGGDQITEWLDVVGLTPTRFVIAAGVDRVAAGGFGYAWVGTVNPDASISLGNEQQFQAPGVNTDRVKRVRAARLNDTDFILAYTFNDNLGRVIVGRVSGSTISYGSPVTFNSGATEHVGIAAVSATDAVVVCRDGGNFNFGTANYIKVTNLVPAVAADVTFNSADTTNISITALDSTRVLAAFTDVGNANFGTAAVGMVGGNTVAFGAEEVFSPMATGPISASGSSGGAALIAYHNSLAAGAGMAVSANAQGSALTFSGPAVFNDSSTPELAIVAVNDTSGAAVFRDGGDASKGKGAAAFSGADAILGLAKSAGTAGQSIPVQLLMPGSVAGGFSGLSAGAAYSGQADGEVSGEGRGVKIGVGLSATEILLTP